MRGWSILVILVAAGCQSSRERSQPQPGPFEGLELAASGAVQAAGQELPVLWLTPSAVVLGSQNLAGISEGQRLRSVEIAAVDSPEASPAASAGSCPSG